MIKMIALDLDNTLLNSDKQISSQTTAQLKKLHQEGIKVVLCTGRPINAIWNYIEQLGLTGKDDYTITFNGGLVINNSNRNELFRRGLKKKGFQALFDFCRLNHYPLDILDFTRVFQINDLKKSQYANILNGNIEFKQTSFPMLPAEETYSKAIMSDEPDVLDSALKKMPETIKGKYHIVRSQAKILEFLPQNVDKAYGLGALLSYFGLNFTNLMAFGDAENDAGMLKAAEVGVAMKNAQPAIKEIANEQTDSNDNDGVEKFLVKYFK